MARFELLLIFFVGEFVRNVMPAFNPLLTYTIRFKKVILHPNITGFYTIDQRNEKQFINANITIDTDLLTDKVVAVFDRCNLEGNDCEYFQSWTLTDICPKLKDKNQVWSQWYSTFRPAMHCPINKKDYQQIDGTFDIGPVARWYPDFNNYQWKVTQKLYSGDTFIGSYTIVMSVFGYRKRNKSISKT